MSKETVLSIARSLLNAVGSYLIGKSFLGTTVDNNLWLGIAGAIVTAGAIIWGIIDKTVTTEMLSSGLRSIIVTFGTILVGSGIVKNEVLESALAIVSIIFPTALSQAAKVENKNVATGKYPIADLSGVDPSKVPIAPDTTPVQSKDLPK